MGLFYRIRNGGDGMAILDKAIFDIRECGSGNRVGHKKAKRNLWMLRYARNDNKSKI